MTAHKHSGQALVELALVMPILVGLITVLFQLGILFQAYLTLAHEMRDIGRWIAVHPDTRDGSSCSDAGSLWQQVCSDVPGVVDPSKITLSILTSTDGVKRDCPSLSGTRCASRTAGTELRLRLAYDASTIIFLPANFRLGPFLNVAIPTALPPYDYSVMVEQH
jgi:hypothetical protein